MRSQGLDFVFSLFLLACSLMILGFLALGEALRGASALLGRKGHCANRLAPAFAAHSAGEFDFHRALEAYEQLIDAHGAARQA